jgi:hypothetical protein
MRVFPGRGHLPHWDMVTSPPEEKPMNRTRYAWMLGLVLTLSVSAGCDALNEMQEVADALEAEQAAANAPKASEDDCKKMMRNGTKIKAMEGPFKDLPPAEQDAELDRVLAEPEMVSGVEECTTTVNKAMADCVIAATDAASFEACRALE